MREYAADPLFKIRRPQPTQCTILLDVLRYIFDKQVNFYTGWAKIGLFLRADNFANFVQKNYTGNICINCILTYLSVDLNTLHIA